MLAVWAFAALPAAAASPDDALNAVIEKIWFNQKSLSGLDSEMHQAAWYRLKGPALALARQQRVALHVAEARLVAYHQWELLATVAYIREGHRADFFTLRYRGLHRAVVRSRDLLQLIDIYGAFIDDAALEPILEQARGLIRGNIYLFEALIDILEPFVNEGTTPYPGIWDK